MRTLQVPDETFDVLARLADIVGTTPEQCLAHNLPELELWETTRLREAALVGDDQMARGQYSIHDETTVQPLIDKIVTAATNRLQKRTSFPD